MLLLLALTIGLIQSTSERPPRPTDEALLDALRAESPAAEIISHSGRDARDGARFICGTARVKGHVEPFHVLTIWDRSGPLAGVIINRETGRPAGPVEAEHWDVSAAIPDRPDADGDGVQSRNERNQDAIRRKLTLMVCSDLTPPDGAVWATEFEHAAP